LTNRDAVRIKRYLVV